MTRYRVDISYDGTAFKGWAAQPGLRTVQDELETWITRVLRLPFVYGDGDAHIEEAVPMMRGFPPSQRLSMAHHVDVGGSAPASLA